MVVLLCTVVVFLCAVVMVMMKGLLLLFLFANRVVDADAIRYRDEVCSKSDSPSRGRTMTRSASRAASRGGSPHWPQAAFYARSDADNVKIAEFCHLLSFLV